MIGAETTAADSAERKPGQRGLKKQVVDTYSTAARLTHYPFLYLPIRRKKIECKRFRPSLNAFKSFADIMVGNYRQ